MTPKARITFLVTSLYGGGAETQLVRLAVGMSERNWSVSIITLMDLNDFSAHLKEHGIEVYSVGLSRGSRDPRALSRVASALRRYRPQILCCFMTHATIVGRLTAKAAGVPYVISSLRNSIIGGWTLNKAIRFTDRLSDWTVLNSTNAAESLIERGLISRERTTVVPNAISESVISPDSIEVDKIKSDLRLPADAFVWLCVGRLEPQKAYDVLLKTFSELSRGRPVRLLIAGEGALEAELRTEIKRLGIDTEVSLLGYRADIASLMAAADGFVLASRWEGLPNVVMEAMLARLPVVATNVGGTPELVTDGQTGFLVEPENPVALKRAMEAMMSLGPEDRNKLVARAYEYVTGNFSSEPVMDKWEHLFLTTIGYPSRQHNSPRPVGASEP